MDILQRHPTTLHPDMRKVISNPPSICMWQPAHNILYFSQTFCRALILLRNKNLISPTSLLTLFFQLLRCPDKELRAFLKNHIITDIKNVNSKSKNIKLNNVRYFQKSFEYPEIIWYCETGPPEFHVCHAERFKYHCRKDVFGMSIAHWNLKLTMIPNISWFLGCNDWPLQEKYLEWPKDCKCYCHCMLNQNY